MWPLLDLATSTATCQGAAIASYSTNVRACRTQAQARDKHEKAQFAWLWAWVARRMTTTKTGKRKGLWNNIHA